MLFEVINKEGGTEMQTSFQECIPSAKTLKEMYAVGYKFKFNGKNISMKAIEEFKKITTSTEVQINER